MLPRRLLLLLCVSIARSLQQHHRLLPRRIAERLHGGFVVASPLHAKEPPATPPRPPEAECCGLFGGGTVAVAEHAKEPPASPPCVSEAHAREKRLEVFAA